MTLRDAVERVWEAHPELDLEWTSTSWDYNTAYLFGHAESDGKHTMVWYHVSPKIGGGYMMMRYPEKTEDKVNKYRVNFTSGDSLKVHATTPERAAAFAEEIIGEGFDVETVQIIAYGIEGEEGVPEQ
jgi:hypothetical protein